MEADLYDVVIVGSGIAGAIMAKTLTNAGKNVLVLEAGLNNTPKDDAETYQGYLETFYRNPIKVPNSPYPNLKNAPSINIIDIQKLPAIPVVDPPSGYLVQKGPLPFASDCFRGPGGTTLHWLGTTLRMLPNDFQMKTLYNQGVDWPLTYDELKPYYQMAELEIGVSGNVDEQVYPYTPANMFENQGDRYVFPMEKIPQSYSDTHIARKTAGLVINLNGKAYRLSCISTPQGRNSIPNKAYPFDSILWDPKLKKLKLERAKSQKTYKPTGSLWDSKIGERCEGNATCVPICPVQAKYNALKSFKRANEDYLTVVTQAVASRVVADERTGEITGIEYKKYQQKDSPVYTTARAKGRYYVLAASAIENAKLLLASNIANSSDQVGRNLMDHQVMLTWGLTKEKVYPYRGPGSTSNIPTFRNGEFRKEHSAWISPFDNWGWSWPAFSPGVDLENALGEGLFGTALRQRLNETVTRQFLLHFEVEQIPDPENRVTIDKAYTDAIGNYRPVIQYNIGEYVLKAFEAAKTVSDQIFEANEIEDHTMYDPVKDPGYVVYKGKGYTYRGAGHIVGTHRMGTAKENSVVNKDQRSWDHPNLFLVGCGNMPTLGTSNPTLTMAALTFRAAEALLTLL